jgi:hypothetical protein
MNPNDMTAVSFSIWDRYRSWRQQRLNVKAMLRLLYLESLRNLSLLDCLDFSAKGSAKDGDTLKDVILALETDVLNNVFYEGRRNARIFSAMNRLGHADEDDADNERPSLSLVLFLQTKIWTLKKIVSMNSKDKALKGIKYKERLRHIQTAYLEIIRRMSEMKEIRPLLKNPDVSGR